MVRSSCSRIWARFNSASKQVAIGIEGVELGIHAAAIAQVGQADAVLQGGHEQFLFFAAFPDPLMRDQGIGDFLERGLNGSLVSNQRAFAFGLGEMDIGFDGASREDWHGNLRREIVRALR